MAKAKTYTVIYEHDGKMWFARVAEIDGCHTQGRTIAQARERIREALGLFDDNADKATLKDDVRLPQSVLEQLAQLEELRSQQAAIAERYRKLNALLAKRLTKSVSLADAGMLLGISKQRVQQVLHEA
jgi:predicted RNase H-like HicB family nuclease